MALRIATPLAHFANPLLLPRPPPALSQSPNRMLFYSCHVTHNKMAINLTKNRDSLLKTWQQVFDDTPDVNW